MLRTAGLLLEEHAAEIQDWIIRESGAIRPKAALEARVGADECFDAAALPHLPQGEVLATEDQRWSFARRRPAGVVSVIAPFNVPLILSIRAVAPALALGNTVLLKPDPRTAVSGGVVLMRLFEEAAVPPGALQLLPGGADIGAAVGAAMQIADRVPSGKVHINEQTVVDESNAPFGGVDDSGNGSRIGGATANLEAFTEVQWLTMRSEIAPYPF